MWGRHKKIRQWLEAGVITEEVANAIESYEQDRKKGHFGRGLVNVSVFAILVGVLSIIASNWYLIPGTVKIGTHVLLNLIVGAVALWADRKDKQVWREGAALAFVGLTLTLIVLIGQVLQLTGSVANATLFWMVITFPFFILMGKTYATAVPWMIAFLVTLVLVMEEYVADLPQGYHMYFEMGLPALLPLALMADGNIARFQRWRPALADVCLKTGAIGSAVLASIALSVRADGGLGLRQGLIENPAPIITVLVIGLLALFAHAVLYKFYKGDERLKHGALFALVGLLCITLPFLYPAYGGAVLSALLFIAYWIFVGWIAQGMGKLRIVSIAITLIAIRIFMVYVEVFGSLMDTGIGLIVGGAVMLGLIYAARKLNDRIRGRGSNHVAP
jgi:uncharacterized membrane protein